MGSLIMFGIPAIIQIAIWIVMIRKRLISTIFTLVLGVISIVVFSDWYIGNVINDPCAGLPDCMNESGMIVIFALMGIWSSIVLSVLAIPVETMLIKKLKQE